MRELLGGDAHELGDGAPGADLEPGQKWTGFHALEKQLWVTGLQPDAAALADQLLADVKELDGGVKAPAWTSREARMVFAASPCFWPATYIDTNSLAEDCM